LITGGITLKGTTPELVNQAEIYNPRFGDVSEDFPFNRPAAEDVASTTGNAEARCQLRYPDAE